MEEFDLYLQYQKDVAESKLKIIESYRKKGALSDKKRTSKINITHRVLKEAGMPLHISEIIDRAKSSYNLELDRDSIVSAILKKVKAGKDFIRTAPNTFAVKSSDSKQGVDS